MPTQDQKAIKTIFKNIFFVKKINSNDIKPVIQRINWVSGDVYDYYQDDIDMFEVDNNGFLMKNFYIKNRYDQVFKCLWNNNGAPSTSEPSFQPGSYGTNNVYKGSDNYKWKYMYTIDIGSKTKFMDSVWMPVSVLARTPNPTLSPEGFGGVEVINVTNGGSGYDPANSAIFSVVISGDGLGAAATATTNNGVITDINVTNSGSNYTYANVSINSSTGVNASFVSPTSPVGGHGFDPLSELGCKYIMITAEIIGNEGGKIPTDIDYRQVGLISNPSSGGRSPLPANGVSFSTSTDFVVTSGAGEYSKDEVVYQGESLETATATGTVLSFDLASNLLHVINTIGTFIESSPIRGVSTRTSRTVLTISPPVFIVHSGYLTYIENRESVQRSSDGIEQFKFVLGY